METTLANQGFQDLKSLSNFLVLLVDHLHELAGAVHILDFLLKLLDIGLATVAERSLSLTVLSSAARVGDIAGWAGAFAVLGLFRGFTGLIFLCRFLGNTGGGGGEHFGDRGG